MHLNSSDFLKYISKKMLNSIHYHKNHNKKDIFLFSSFRSGSTWLAELIKSQKGIKFAISPNKIEFLANIDDYYKQIKKRPYYIQLDSREKEIIKNYINNTSDGSSIYGRRYVDLFSSEHSFITDRSIYRLLRSNYLIDWYNENFNIFTIFLLRHPIAASLSRKKIWEVSKNPDYWSPNTTYFLNSDYFVSNYLKKEQLDYLKSKLKNSGVLEKFVISWALENFSMIQRAQSKKLNENIIFVTYENLLINPEKIINYLSKKLDLSAPETMLKKIKVPSSTVNYSDDQTKNKFAANNYDPQYLLKKWKKEVRPDTEKEIFNILKKLNINIYQLDRFRAQDEFII